MKILSFLFLLLVLPTQITAQVTQEWVRFYNSPGNVDDLPSGVAVDAAGNIYVIGSSGTFPNGYDYTLIKYNPDGEVIWVRNYDHNNLKDECYAIALDSEGNIYLTGQSKSTNLDTDIATIKYDPSGTQLWVQRYNASTSDVGQRIGIDDNNNIYVGGSTVGSGVIIKYNSSGAQQWAQPIDGFFRTMTVDNIGNVYIGGSAIVNSTVAIVMKYNTNGNFQWTQNAFGTLVSNQINGIAVDNDGSVFVTGNYSGKYATAKFSSAGAEQWIQLYGSEAGATPHAIALDNAGNAFVTGNDNINLPTNGVDVTTVKYSSAGDQIWTRTYNGPNNRNEDFRRMITDEEGNVYVYGFTSRVVNNFVVDDPVIIKYSSEGDTLWIQTYDAPSSDRDVGIAIDNNLNVYATGFTFNQTNLFDIFLIKYSQPQTPGFSKPTPYSKFIAGETDTIKWTDPGWIAVNIKYIANFETPAESEIVLAQGIPNLTSEFIWNVPETVLSFRTKIIIENANNTTEKIESDIFRIKPYVLTRLNPDSTYYEYRKNRDQFNVVNDSTQMWPFSFYQQFKYRTGIDPFTNMLYSDIQGDSTFSKAFFNTHPDWVSWVNTFSTNACYFSVQNGWYKPSSILKWRAEVDNWGGSCFGIAAANALAFVDSQIFREKYPNFPAFVNPITVVSDTGVKRVVNELYTYQYGNPTQANDKLNHNIVTPIMLLEQLKQMFLEDNARIRTLSIYNNGGSGGHTILAYGLKKDPIIDGLYYVSVYDNSNPNSNIPIQISTVSNGGNGAWGTAEPSWAGWGGNSGIYLEILAEQYYSPTTFPRGEGLQSPFVIPTNELHINSKFGAQIKILDNQGNITGYENGFALSGIPGSLPRISRNGSETPPYGYSLQADNYSVVLNEFEEDTVETFFFTGNKSFMYERSGADQTQTDRLFFDGGVSATNPDAQTKTIKLLNLLNENTREKIAVIRSIELAQNDSVKIENPDSNKVKLISYGPPKDYDIELNYVTENEFGRFVGSDVPLAANTSHTFVPVWTDLTNSELQVLVDIGNDGTIDDTLSLVNQVTGIGDDQGSLVTPNSYNLAQNYPNPFNPSTKISWQSPVGSHQTLKVYDVLGNEVATLVDEFRNAGRYEVTFDATQLASGIYFYRLQAGSFVETKKMILLR